MRKLMYIQDYYLLLTDLQIIYYNVKIIVLLYFILIILSSLLHTLKDLFSFIYTKKTICVFQAMSHLNLRQLLDLLLNNAYRKY